MNLSSQNANAAPLAAGNSSGIGGTRTSFKVRGTAIAGVLTFDYRGMGTSDGTPRQVIDPWAQPDDLRGAINHARAVPWANPDKVVLWGTSFAGGHVLHVGAEDPRLAGVISQVPHANGLASASTVPPTTFRSPACRVRSRSSPNPARSRLTSSSPAAPPAEYTGTHLDAYRGPMFEQRARRGDLTSARSRNPSPDATDKG
jgi:hypothetical protein